MNYKAVIRLLLTSGLCIAAGCERRPAKNVQTPSPKPADSFTKRTADSEHTGGRTQLVQEPCRLILLSLGGETELDKKIARAQEQVTKGNERSDTLERLGWLFVAKARVSFDPGFYKLAEQSALCMEGRTGHTPEALLLRGHALHNLHRFKDAEPLAQELVARRGLPFDFGLLGDVLMEQGKLDDAAAAYQRMVDLRPDLQSYSRGAHLRWLKGDVEGAAELMSLAASAATPLDAESAAWVHTRLAGYEFQAGLLSEAQRCCAAALEYQSNYPPALLLRGRMLLAESKAETAVQALQFATELNPLPEYQWTFAEVLRAAGRPGAAEAVEANLRRHGAATDPRTLALFLATRGETPAIAVHLARAELDVRQDVFTHDALAWALAAEGQWAEAAGHVERALAEGTQDARLFLHAAIVCRRLGRIEEADTNLKLAKRLERMLLPSERGLLAAEVTKLVAQSVPNPNGISPAGMPALSVIARRQ